jgi:hypothetical protein
MEVEMVFRPTGSAMAPAMASLSLVALLAVAGLLAACAGQPELNASTDASGVPVWVNEGSNILTSKQGRHFHGVGSAPMLGDFSLQTVTADNRAKAEVARVLASYMEIVSRDYIASGDADAAGFSGQDVSHQMSQLEKIRLDDVEVIGHWQDKESKTVYAIAEVDMETVRKALQAEAELNPGLKAYLDAKGDTIFDRISTEVK